jgi:hypothetical protein
MRMGVGSIPARTTTRQSEGIQMGYDLSPINIKQMICMLDIKCVYS